MLKMLIGLLDIDGGSISFDGQEISGMTEAQYAPVRRRVAMLFQAGALFDSLNTKENVAYGLREQLDMSETQISERVRESLTYVGLPGTEETAPADLSAGMKKRVSLARALAIRPEVLLYDEPTTGLDPINVTRIADLIQYSERDPGRDLGGGDARHGHGPGDQRPHRHDPRGIRDFLWNARRAPGLRQPSGP